MQSLSTSGPLKAAADVVALSHLGMGGVAIQITGTFSGTVTFESSVDGQNFRALLVTPSNSTTQASTATAAGLWFGNITGTTIVRARMSSYTSGTASLTIKAVLSSPASPPGSGGGTSSAVSITDGVDPSIAATVKDYTNSNPLAIIAVDTNGDPASFGGNAAAGPTGSAVPASADYQGFQDSSGNLIGMRATNLDYDSGAGTVGQTVMGVAIAASGGPIGVSGGHGTAATALRVELPTDGTGVIATVGAVTALTNALPAGTNVIGHVIADTGSTTAVTGNVTVVQSTSTNLKADITIAAAQTLATVTTVGAVTAITNALPAGTNVIGHVITDTGSTTAVTGTVTVSGAVTEATLDAALIAQEATTSGIKGLTAFGAVTTAAPSYTTAKSDALSLTTAGGLRTDLASIAGTAAVNGSGTATGALRVELPTNGTGVVGLNAGSALVGKVGLDQTTPGTTNAVSLAQIGGTTIVNGGVAGSQSVGGTVATNTAITANPLNLGAQAVSSENAAVTTARQVQLVADLVGKLIVLPYANPENFVSGAITTAMTGTTSTSLIAAPASGLRNYITQVTVSNAHATVGTDMIIQDGSGGTTLYTIPAAAAYGGATLSFPTPLRQPTTATAIYIQNVTTGASTKASASGYKGA